MSLNSYLQKKVCIITVDGRTLQGKLFSCDNQTNLVLESAIERVIRPHEDDESSQEVSLGLYIIRGDNVCVVGLVDEQVDESINWADVRGDTIGTTKHV